MKKLFWIAAFTGLGLCGTAQNNQTDTSGADKYCVAPRGSGVYVTHNGKEIEADVHLENGTIIHPDGLVETPERFFTMKTSQCIRRDGRMEEENATPGDKGTAGK
jgi:hypothetical protein